ncbi:hypothetical protein A9K55_009206 [Cordyceps militaris]|uniref:Uncharacterized protein n=1 Tax=Cordyceps militaris TaxID=73501 RepID=A0A2H4SKA4_CORMI|nr:hypothetical protein A9K55_009206 [Cordyceps militaris]
MEPQPFFLTVFPFRPDNKRVRVVVPVGRRNEKKRAHSPKPIHSNAQDDNQTALACDLRFGIRLMDRCRALDKGEAGAERQPSSSISNYLSNHEPIVRRIMCYSTRRGNKQDKVFSVSRIENPHWTGREQVSCHPSSHQLGD